MNVELNVSESYSKERGPAYERALRAGATEAVRTVTQLLHQEMVKNLSGPLTGRASRVGGRLRRIKPTADPRTRSRRQLSAQGFRLFKLDSLIRRDIVGRTGRAVLPVPRVTGNLARAAKATLIDDFTGLVYADENVASYAPYVHRGTRNADGSERTPPREYLGEPVRNNRRAFQRLAELIVQRSLAEV